MHVQRHTIQVTSPLKLSPKASARRNIISISTTTMSPRLIHRLGTQLPLRTRSLPSTCQCARQLRIASSRTGATGPRSTPAANATETLVRNPLDVANNRKRIKKSLQDDWRQFRLLSLGVVVSMGMILAIMTMVKLPDGEDNNNTKDGSLVAGLLPKDKADAGEKAKEFQGKPVVIAPGGTKLLAHDDKTGDEIELIPTGTSSVPHFPRTIRLPVSETGNADDAEYTLLGLGIRTVSFLGIQVYVVGLYVRTSSLAALQSRFIKRVNPLASALIPGEKEALKKDLLDFDKSYALWDELLSDTNGSIESAIRIVPTRNTDFAHLRDGFVRGITQRTQAAQQKGDKQFSDQSFGQAMKDVNAIFGGKGKAPKGTVLFLTRDGQGKLSILYQENVKDVNAPIAHFGSIADERIARLLWLGYLGGKNVSTEDARKSVVDGIIELVERPVGTAAMKVA
jgi:hypothetical protein